MQELRDVVRIAAPPAAVWEWLLGFADHYTDWHPDHVEAAWVRGGANRVGSVLRVVEAVGGKREALRFELVELVPPWLYRYRILGAHGLLLPEGSFEVRPENGGALLTARVQMRGGALLERLLASRIVSLRRHMSEEGANLARLVEAAMAGYPDAAILEYV